VRFARRLGFAVVLSALVLAPSAGAFVNTSYVPSQIWSGYTASEKGLSMDRVAGSWTAPSARCANSKMSFSEVATWVGLGALTAVEQIGTDTTCEPAQHKHPFGSAWWEDYPAPSHAINHPLGSGDRLQASIAVNGHTVTLTLADLSRHWRFVKRTTDPSPDLSAAEWIVEDPAANCCQYFPLAEFSPVKFTDATARSAGGRPATITGPPWGATKYAMIAGKPKRLLAWPSALSAGGSAFTVTRTDRAPPTVTPPVARDLQ
jgi:hypothetical protein